jgi:hypothetical protein
MTAMLDDHLPVARWFTAIKQRVRQVRRQYAETFDYGTVRIGSASHPVAYSAGRLENRLAFFDIGSHGRCHQQRGYQG